jgi:hypothetical protein
LDFMLMNGGSGSTQTEESVGRVLIALARTLRRQADRPAAEALATALLPLAEADGSPDRSA